MSRCPAFDLAGAGLAQGLKAVDCLTGDATAIAFGRLFGPGGALGLVLTLSLTLYVAFLAIGLLTGRARIGLSALTPRALTLGLVLTFATSWVAYQSVVWNLAVGAPDQIAGVLSGSRGSATLAFADRLDRIVAALAEATAGAQAQAAAASPGGAPAVPASAASLFSPADLVQLSMLLLLLATAGVLVTAKVALAALLAVGPLFILMALFPGARGLFEGWLKGTVLFALVPLVTTLVGGAGLALLAPAAEALAREQTISTRAATGLFLAAAVHGALMAMALKVAATLVAGWRVPGGSAGSRELAASAGAPAAPFAAGAPALAGGSAATRPADERIRAIVTGLGTPAVAEVPPPGGGTDVRVRAVAAAAPAVLSAPGSAPSADPRARGLAARFRAPQPAPAKRLA